MFGPLNAISELDTALARTGQDVAFKRGLITKAMRAFVRGFKPEEIVGLIQQGDQSVVVSPTSFGVFGAPKAQDKAVVGGVPVTVQHAEIVRLAGTVVRVNLVVRG